MVPMSGKKSSLGNKFPKRGEIYWVDLDPVRGHETQKKRPGLIVSNDIGNEVSHIVMVAPITSKVVRIGPFEVKTVVDGTPAKIMLNQCRALDKSRLSKFICAVDLDTMLLVEEAIKVVFGIS
jgi:mRNA interferase MazF